ncbi:unnamed protein product [Caenorhabditis sp. 36 PRJEB53466]|nr:unnamed protein product [Caenorhabditis sp. 36 PRJEB53466]
MNTLAQRRAISRRSLAQVFRFYVPESLRGWIKLENIPAGDEEIEGKGVDLLQYILDNSMCQLRMYGTAEELVENLEIFRNFTGCHKLIPLDPWEPTDFAPNLELSITTDEYCNKSLFYHLLESWIFRTHPKETGVPFVGAMVARFFKVVENRSNCATEYFPYAHDLSTQMMNEMLCTVKTEHAHELMQTKEPFSHDTGEQMYEAWTGLFTKNKEELGVEFNTGKELCRLFFSENHPLEKNILYRTLYCFFVALVRSMDRLQEKYPDYIRPHSQVKGNKLPITLRVFVDGCREFAICEEVETAFNELYGNNCSIEEVSLKLETVDLVDVLKRERSDEIQYIRVEIKRTAHTAVPIETKTGKNLFRVETVPEGRKEAMAVSDRPLFEMGFFYFNDDRPMYFMETAMIEVMSNELHGTFSASKKTKANFVRNAKSTGFTVEMLENELVHLGLVEKFPEICDCARLAHEKISEDKKGEILRTVDLFDAVEHCLLLCIIKQFPYLMKFLHNQHACDRVFGIQCPHCFSIPSVEFKNTKWNVVKPEQVELTECIFNRTGYLPLCQQLFRGPDGFELHYNHSVFITAVSICCQEASNGDKAALERMELNFWNQWETYKYPFEVFLVDTTEIGFILKYIKNCVRNRELRRCPEVMADLDFLTSLTKFTNWYHSARLYLRTVSMTWQTENQCVFAKEVLEMLPILLRRQKNSMRQLDYIINKYRKTWTVDIGYLTISLDELNDFLEYFDIDKTQLTLVPDILFMTTKNCAKTPMVPSNVFGSDMRRMTTAHDMLSFYFQSVLNDSCFIICLNREQLYFPKDEETLQKIMMLRNRTFVPFDLLTNTLSAGNAVKNKNDGSVFRWSEGKSLIEFFDAVEFTDAFRARTSSNLGRQHLTEAKVSAELLKLIYLLSRIMKNVRDSIGDASFLLDELSRDRPIKINGNDIILLDLIYDKKGEPEFSLKDDIRLENRSCTEWQIIQEFDRLKREDPKSRNERSTFIAYEEDCLPDDIMKLIIPVFGIAGKEQCQNAVGEVVRGRHVTVNSGTDNAETATKKTSVLQQKMKSGDLKTALSPIELRQLCDEMSGMSRDEKLEVFDKISGMIDLDAPVANLIREEDEEISASYNRRKAEEERRKGSKNRNAKTRVNMETDDPDECLASLNGKHDIQEPCSALSKRLDGSTRPDEPGTSSQPSTQKATKKNKKSKTVAPPAPPPPRVVNFCEKCTRTNELCGEMKEKTKKLNAEVEELNENVRSAQGKLTEAKEKEQESERTEEEMEKKLRELKEKFAAQTERIREAEELESTLEKLEREEKELKIENEKLETQLSSLNTHSQTEDMSRLTRALEEKQNQNEELEKQVVQLSILSSQRERTQYTLLEKLAGR